MGSASVAKRGTGMLKEHPGQESMIVTMTGFASGLHTLCNKTRFRGQQVEAVMVDEIGLCCCPQ